MKLGLQGKVRRRIFDSATGRCVFDSGFCKNIIQDKFFANLGAATPYSIATNICGAAQSGVTASATNMTAGSGNTNPLRVDSTPTTLSQSGTTVTASASFFTSGMVGRLLVFGAAGAGNNPCYITGFTSGTQVTVSTTATVSSQVGSVYTVSGWALSGTQNSSTVIPTTAGDNGTALAAGVYTYTTTRQWAVQGSAITYLQIALKDNAGNIIAGFQIPGAGDTVNAGFFYVVTWAFAMTLSPNVPTAVGNIGSGLNTAGNAMLESIDWFSTISSAGAPGGSAVMDGRPADIGSAGGLGILPSGTWTQNANTSATPPSLSAFTGYTVSTLSETTSNPANTGTAVNTVTAVFNTTGNGAVVTGIMLVNSSHKVVLDVQFTSTYTSPGSGTFTFTFTFTFTIGRIVNN